MKLKVRFDGSFENLPNLSCETAGSGRFFEVEILSMKSTNILVKSQGRTDSVMDVEKFLWIQSNTLRSCFPSKKRLTLTNDYAIFGSNKGE